jgi:hypothetical protein
MAVLKFMRSDRRECRRFFKEIPRGQEGNVLQDWLQEVGN